jgi:uncharacterized protein (DUF2147 family)
LRKNQRILQCASGRDGIYSFRRRLDRIDRRRVKCRRSDQEIEMNRGNATRLCAALVLLGATAGAAAASDATGVWLRDSGASRVRVAPCGGALCGTVVWLRDTSGPAKVGQRVFFDMKPAGEGRWSGKAFNPEDGKTYSGSLSVSGNTLTTSGCVLGVICRSVNWSRVH